MDSKLLDTKGRAYAMAQPHPDPVLPFVRPGTPGGELLRRYWQPIALSSEATDLPKLIRRFGEDLILLRTKGGEPRASLSTLLASEHEPAVWTRRGGWHPLLLPRLEIQQSGRVPGSTLRAGRRAASRSHPTALVSGRRSIRRDLAYLGPPEKQPLFPIFSCFEGLRDDEEIVASWFSSDGEISPFPLDHNWYQVYDNCADHYHVPILHSMISGNQFPDPRLTSRIPEIWWKYSDAGDSILTYSKRVLERSGDVWMRIEQGIIPNLLALPPFVGDGESLTVTAFVPIDDTNCMPMDISRQPKNFQPQLASGDFGFGPEKKFWGQMTLEDHQRHPLDYEAQASQGKISFHSQEHLVSSDKGVSMHRRLFRKQCEIVAQGGDPVGVAYAEKDRVIRIGARSWMIAASEVKAEEPA